MHLSRFFLALLLLFCASGAQAALRAVLVGVSTYEKLDEGLQLQGPANDVGLLYEFLLTRGIAPADVVMLAEQPLLPAEAKLRPGRITLPTRKAIMDALDEMALKARAGDTVVLQFAGHATQAPVLDDRDEADGLDEMFLPRDVQKWYGGRGPLENAIRDDEIGAAIDRIRQRGALVWAIFDTCHAGTLTRSLGPPAADGIKLRGLDWEDLGVPKSLREKWREKFRSRSLRWNWFSKATRHGDERPRGWGGLVAFYASSSAQRTPELPFSKPALLLPQQELIAGMFTAALFVALNAEDPLTYSEVMTKVGKAYKDLKRLPQKPSPQYEGTDVDSAVLQGLPRSAALPGTAAGSTP